MRIATASLQQQHAVALILTEPVRQHTARGARADDDVIEGVQVISLAGSSDGVLSELGGGRIFSCDEIPWNSFFDKLTRY